MGKDWTPIKEAIEDIAREFYGELGKHHVFLDARFDAVTVEFGREGVSAHFDTDIFDIVGWQPCVSYELAELARKVRQDRARKPAFVSPRPVAADVYDERRRMIQEALDAAASARLLIGVDPGAPCGDFVGSMVVVGRDVPSLSSLSPQALLLCYEDAQRERVLLSHVLNPAEIEIARLEWSRRLRGKVEASKSRERNQVLCDLQDEP